MNGHSCFSSSSLYFSISLIFIVSRRIRKIRYRILSEWVPLSLVMTCRGVCSFMFRFSSSSWDRAKNEFDDDEFSDKVFETQKKI